MKKIMISFLLLILCIAVKAQEIKIVDETSLQPINNVFIYSKTQNHSILTNQSGRADFSTFKEDSLIVFQHPSFQKKVLPYKKIKDKDFILKLTPSSIDLESVVVSANKWEQKKTEIPNKIVKLKPAKIEFYNPQTTADLLSASNEVFVQKSQLGGGSPMLRGFATNSVLIVVDGVRMNNAIFRSGNLQNVISIDHHMLESSEVILGPGSVIYGSDALGGVMDFHTKKPKLGDQDKKNITSNALLRYATANKEKTIHADANIGWEKWALTTGVTYSNYNNLRSGSNHPDDYPDFGKRNEYVKRLDGHDSIVENDDPHIQKFSGYNQLNITQKVRFNPSDKIDFNYGFHYSTTSDIPRYDRLTQRTLDSTLEYGDWYYGPQKWMMHNLTTKIKDVSSLFDQAKITMAYQSYEESRHDRDIYSDTMRHRTEMVDIYTLNVDMEKSLTESSSLFYGLEGVYNHVNSEANCEDITTDKDTATATRYPSGGSDYNTFAAYALYKNNFSSKFTLNTGIRYSNVSLLADFKGASLKSYDFPFDTINLNTGAFNGLLGMVYRPDQNWQFKLNGSSGFRAPNVDDVAKVFDSEPGTVIVPNADLKPEYAYNLESSIIRKIKDFLQLEITGYCTWLDNAIVRRDYQFKGKEDSIKYDGTMSKVKATVNKGSAFIYGGSAKLNADISKHWTTSLNYVYTKGEDQDGVPLRHVAPGFGNFTLTYQSNKLKSSFYINYNASKKWNDLSPSEQSKTHMYTGDGTPAWYTLNLMIAYQLNNTLGLNLGCKNILDRHYRPYSSGISAPGRNFVISINGNF